MKTNAPLRAASAGIFSGKNQWDDTKKTLNRRHKIATTAWSFAFQDIPAALNKYIASALDIAPFRKSA